MKNNNSLLNKLKEAGFNVEFIEGLPTMKNDNSLLNKLKEAGFNVEFIENLPVMEKIKEMASNIDFMEDIPVTGKIKEKCNKKSENLGDILSMLDKELIKQKDRLEATMKNYNEEKEEVQSGLKFKDILELNDLETKVFKSHSYTVRFNDESIIIDLNYPEEIIPHSNLYSETFVEDTIRFSLKDPFNPMTSDTKFLYKNNYNCMDIELIESLSVPLTKKQIMDIIYNEASDELEYLIDLIENGEIIKVL